MSKCDVTVSLDAGLLARAKAGGLDVTAALERALRHALAPATRAEDRRWAEDNALAIEALAGGAAEAD
jgi:post-segregation antitoxin (ccd killing protein)